MRIPYSEALRILSGGLLAIALFCAPAHAQFENLPPEPPQCLAGQAHETPNGLQTANGSGYCFYREVLGYATPPEGWEPYVGTVSVATALFPTAPWGHGFLVPSNYPHVVFTYQRGNPNGYPIWPDNLVVSREVPNAPIGSHDGFFTTGNTIRLVQLNPPCEPTEFTCAYEIQPKDGTPGEPPEWYRVRVSEHVDGGGAGLDLYDFATLAAGLGLVKDGNAPPAVGLVLSGSTDASVEITADVVASDEDPIAGYYFDWGDGETTQSATPRAVHTYASAAPALVQVFVPDSKGAVGYAFKGTGCLVTPVVTGPHTMDVGEQIQIDVTATNVGSATVNIGHNYGYEATPPPNVTQLVSNPSFSRTLVARGGSIMGSYVVKGLKDATVRFAFGVTGTGAGPGCAGTFSRFVEHEVVIGTGLFVTPTATPGSAGTPTPTATPGPSVPGLPDPDAAKVVSKCQSGLAKARSGAQAARLKALDACGGKLSRCVQTKPGDGACLDKAADACAKAKEKLAAVDEKLTQSAAKACGALTTGDLLAANGLDADRSNPACAAPVTNLASLGACLVTVTACVSGDLTEATQPRLAQLLALAGVDSAGLPCLDDLGGTGDVGDAKLGKSVDACRAAISKGMQAFVAARAKGLEACAGAVTKCVQEKPDDPGCLTKAGAKCTKAVAGRAATSDKLRAAIGGKCAIDFPTLAAESGLGLGALGSRCAALGVASLGTLDDYVTCLERLTTCRTDDATAVAVPRLAELLGAVGQPFGEAFCN